jgi:CHAT domain-containing protein
MRRLPLSRIAAVALLLGTVVERRALVDDLAEITPGRTVAPRLSISASHRPCSHKIPADGTIPVTHCRGAMQTAAAVPAVARLWARAREELHTPDAAEALHAAGLLGLLWSSSGGAALDEPVSSLQRAAKLDGGSARLLGDLSAAYLVRAGRTQNPRDLLEAITSADEALTVDPGSPAARFNLALALDWLGLNDQAREAWVQYLTVDSKSGWAREARSRLRALEADAPAPPPASGASAAEIDAYVSRNPQEARLRGWDHLLGEWGEAVLRGDKAQAADRLRQSQLLGDALARRGGDATLAEAVRAIRERSVEDSATRTLARAHVEYAAGQAAYFDVDHEAARAHFARVLEIRPPSAQLERWAHLFHAAMIAQGGELERAEGVLRPLARSDTVRYPALAGRARWVLGTVLLRGGRSEAALEAALDGARLLGRAGEREYEGAAQYVAADAQFYLGATLAARGTAHRALTTLRRYRHSVWLLNTLAATARTAEADGLTVAAVRIQDERVDLAQRIGHPARIAEARLGRARVLAAAGMLPQARADLDASQPLVRAMREGRTRTWLETELRLASASYFAAGEPARAEANLNLVLAAPIGSLTAPRRLGAHIARAEARLAQDRVPAATADLDAASLLLAQKRSAIARTELRASLLDAARGVFDQLAMLRVEAGDTVGALRYLERGRASFGLTARGLAGVVEERWRTRPGEVAISYALVRDTLLAWTIAGSSVRLTLQAVNRASLIGSIEELRLSLERGDDDPAVRRTLTALYDRLIAPLEARLGDESTTVVIVADGELASVPFSALYDSRNGRHLVEAHPLRYAGSLHDATQERARSAGGSTLLVADPAFDARVHPGLPRLPGARQEVDSIARVYPDRRAVLADSGAVRGALEAGIARARIVHFAGHAVFDDQRPERSYLVLAPEPGTAGRGWLTAAEMEELPLAHVDLFVLSACQTLRSRSGRSGGFAGFAGALLNAGAGGVVGSLWRVDDDLTAPLMLQFHRAYRRSGDGPRALREAQLRLLHSRDPSLRSPTVWAAFHYAGN